MASPVDPMNKKLLVVLIFAGILMVVLIALLVTVYYGSSGPGRSTGNAEERPVNQVTTQTRDFTTTGGTNKSVPPPGSTAIPGTTPPGPVTSIQNPVPSPVISDQPAVTGPPVPASGDSSGPVIPEPFTLSVSPASASGKPGETISYTLRIDGGEGQTEPIHFTLIASALFFTQTYELGEEQPPFPKTTVYQFTIPSNIPSGITINGVLTATGAGQTREQQVTLQVL